MKLFFYGGARSVTGANYLLEIGSTKLLVDCGMFQGSKYSEDLNYEKFLYNPAEVGFVFITHSHTDHVGRLPKLYKEGFRGKVVATNATLDLIRKALPDNLRLIEQEAKDTGREPLFSLEDLRGVLELARGVDYEESIELPAADIDGALSRRDRSQEGQRTPQWEGNIGTGTVKLHDAGHILGSSIIEIRLNAKKI